MFSGLFGFVIYQGLVKYKCKKDKYGYYTSQIDETTIEKVTFPHLFIIIFIITFWIPILNIIIPHIACGTYLTNQGNIMFQKQEGNKVSKFINNIINWLKSGI